MKMNTQRPVSGNKKTSINTKKQEEVTKNILENRKKTIEIDREVSPTPSSSKSFKGSLIPKLIKDNHIQKKGNLDINQRQNKTTKRPLTPVALDDYQTKLQKLEERENVIAEYYNKIEALIHKIVEKRSAEKIKEKALQKKILVKNCLARKMISDPSVFKSVIYNKNLFSEFESGVYEISDIWLKTSTDLANSLKNMKNDSYIYASDFETEKMKIQKAIKRARSFTLIKTKNVIAEARKLLIGSEIIRRGPKALLNREVRAKANEEERAKIPVEAKTSNGIKFPRQICHKVKSSFEIPKKPVSHTKILNEYENTEQTKESTEREPLERVQNGTDNIGDSAKPLETEKKGKNCIVALGAPMREEIETWRENLAKSKEQVAVLKGKVFNLQKACNDYSFKCNDVQIRLVNFSKRIQCDEIFVDEIEKANENVTGEPQLSIAVPNEKVQDLVQTKVKNLNDELEVLAKLNNLLIQQKAFLDQQTKFIGDRTVMNSNAEKNRSDHFKALEKQCEIAEKIVNEKRSAVGQLRGILDVMKHQESIALKQKALFEEKIEVLKKKES